MRDEGRILSIQIFGDRLYHLVVHHLVYHLVSRLPKPLNDFTMTPHVTESQPLATLD